MSFKNAVEVRYVFYFLICFMLLSCSRESETPNMRLETVKMQVANNKLFYSGTIQPLSTRVVTSPADGVIVDMPFQYGDTVKQSQPLFVLSSTKFLTDYKSALLQYVKAKSEFNTSQTQLKETEFLHKNELVSDDDFKMKQSSFYAAQLGLLQARDALDTLLQEMDINDIDLDKLAITDIDKITKAMHLEKKSENIKIDSPVNGIALSASKSEDDAKKFFKGDVVKQGDVLGIIGDMTGISVKIRVNEVVVNQLSPGQQVKITGIAFPQHELIGKIDRVDHQGEISNGGLPTFAVLITVPKLTTAQQKLIHAGMSSEVEINLSEAASVMVPVQAIIEQSGNTYIKVFDESTREFKTVTVRTGKTNMTSVTILSGLKPGDRIAVPSQT